MQREEDRRHAFDARLADAQLEVPDISESEGLKLAEKDARDHPGSQHGTGASEDPTPDVADGTPAEGARPHLDLLA